ncbi:MAG: acyltransferase [Actinobacteria bacterium]|nr:acyltransferase [Actinomycetota bacterium]
MAERPSTRVARPRYRADIDGLRTLAILLVVVYHVWLGRVSGGVDVFLMISAFFLTDSLVRRVIDGRPLRLGMFWLRRFRRLLPAAAVTLLALLAAAYFLYPPNHWQPIWDDTWASLFYWQNWHLAFSSVDYYARDATSTSPLQHFWSLSVQGQVFILWPALIGLVEVIFRRARHLVRPALIVVFSAIFVWSLWFSIAETADSQAFAYFDTRTRLWEFAAGSLLALVLPLLRVPQWFRAALGWIGVVGIVTCGLVLDVRGGFPGFLALWPVLSTAAIIVAGAGEGSRGGPARLLASKSLRFFSGDAYALYLIHWPLLITWLVVTGKDRVGLLQGGAIILASMVLARLLSWGVEHPLQRAAWFDKRAWRSALVIVLCLGLVGGSVATWQGAEERRAAEIMASAAEAGYPGAAAVQSPLTTLDRSLPVIPVATELDAEWLSVGDSCSGRFAPESEVLTPYCNQSPASAGADQTVLIIGDSHAQQLGVPMEAYAEQHGIGVVTLLKGGCTIGPEEPDRGTDNPYTCAEWLPEAIDCAVALKPTAVYVIATRATAGEPERVLEGADRTISALLDAGISVIAVRDNPRFDFDMYSCVARGEDCSVPAGQILASENPATTLDKRVTLVDYTPWLCPDLVCQGEIGNIAVYIDSNHVSHTYAETLTPMLGEILSRHSLFP